MPELRLERSCLPGPSPVVGLPRYVVGGIVVYPAEEKLEILGLDVESHILEQVPELRQAQESLAFRVVLVEDRLGVI